MPSMGFNEDLPKAKEEKELNQEDANFVELRVSGTGSPDEYPLLVTMPSGEKVRICCKPTDTILEIKKVLWSVEALREDMSLFILRLRNAETFYADKQPFRDMLGHFLLFREESFHDTLEAVLMDKRDIGDSEKRKTKVPTLTGLNRAQGFLKKKGSGATHKWQERYFVLQDNTLFYFGSYEDYDRRMPASEVIPMGSCIAEAVAQGRPVHSQNAASWSGGEKGPLPPLSRQASTGRKLQLMGKGEVKAATTPVRYIFRLAADAVGKREFLLRTKSSEVMRLFVHSIQSLNLQRIKLIVLDTTKELLERTNRDLVVSSQISESKEAQAVLRAYAYAQYPKLKGLDDLVLSEVLCSALSALEAPLLSAALAQGFHKCGLERITPQQIKTLLVQNIHPAYRSLFEYLISFFHIVSSRPETTGVSIAYIAKLMEEAMFGPPDPFIRALDRVGVLQVLIEKRTSLWPLTIEAHMQELRDAIFAATPLPNRLRRPPALEMLATPRAKERRSSRVQMGPSPGALIKAKEKADKGRITCVQFPLTFHVTATSETGPHSIEVRVFEELVAVESRPFSPGRFYAMDDLLHPRLGNQLGCMHEAALGPLASHLTTLEYGQKQMAFVPEVIALGYLFQRGNLIAVTQITSYLSYRQPLPKKPNNIPTEPGFMDRTRRQTLAKLEEKTNRPRKSSRASHYDDDDDFVDIDTSAPPPETPRYAVQPSPRPGKTGEPFEWKKPSRRVAPPPPPQPAVAQLEEEIPPPPSDDPDVPPPKSGTICPHEDPQVFCAECKEALCSTCDGALHQNEKTSHVREAFKSIAIAITEPKDQTPPPPVERPILNDDPFTIQDRRKASLTESAHHIRTSSDSLNEFSYHSRTDSSSRSSRHSPQASMADASHLKIIEKEAGEKVLKPITFGADSTFESVMRFGEARSCFRKFLASEFAEENILFWDEVNKFCETDVHTQYKLAQHIFATYFGPQATKQVNVRGMFAQLKEVLACVDEAEAVAQCTFLFLEAQTAVVQLLKYDSFGRFKASGMWQAFVDNFKQREWVRFKVVKMKKMHKNVVRVIQFDSNSMALTFFKPDHEGEYTQEELRVPAGSLVNVQLSVTNNKKLKLTFFKTDQRLLRNQKEWRLIFRTTAERERLARVITSNLLLKQSSATQRAAYQPQPLVMEKKTLQALTMLPVEDVACALHGYYVSGKRSEGWIYGDVYNEEEKTDPKLISWHHMGEKERAYDLDVASLIIGSILELGFTIKPQSYEEALTDLEEDSRLLLLVEFLSENTHDCWAANKMKQGWIYGEARNQQEKTHPNLIPYIDLDEAHMDWNRQAAIQVLRALIERGFRIEPVE